MRWSTCALCPRLCRSSCPVATGSGREAATPSVIADVVWSARQGLVPEELVKEFVGLCTDCGGCQDHCHLDMPLPIALRELRAEVLPRPSVEPLQGIVGRHTLVAVESDERPFAAALSKALDQPVARWPTGDRFGVAALEHGLEDHLRAIARSAEGRSLVVCDGGVAEVLEAAQVRFQWLRSVVRDLPAGRRSCRQGGASPLRCCGAAGPLKRSDPESAERLGKLWLDRVDDWVVRDARCREHLRSCGGEVVDPLDALLERM